MRIDVFDGPIDGAHVSVSSITANGAPVTVGRGQDADLSIADRWISRRHCQFYPFGGGYAVRDLGSRHGTFLNGKRITQARLKPGDEIRIGLSSLVLSSVPMRQPRRGSEDKAERHYPHPLSPNRSSSVIGQSGGKSSQLVHATQCNNSQCS